MFSKVMINVEPLNKTSYLDDVIGMNLNEKVSKVVIRDHKFKV